MKSQTSERYGRGLFSGFLEAQRLRQTAQLIEPGDSVLDLACNEGALIDRLPSGVDYVGVDISAAAIEQARTRHPRHTFIVADLADPQREILGDAQFDAIVILAFLEHIKRPGELIRRYEAYLKPGGKMIITTPSPHGRRIHDYGARIGLFSKSAAEEHETFLDRCAFETISRETGLTIRFYRRFLFGFNQLVCLAH